MGAADKANPMSDTNREKLGAYNVHVKITDINGTVQELDARTWKQSSDYLALDIREDLQKDKLLIISLRNVYSYEVTPQDRPKVVA